MAGEAKAMRVVLAHDGSAHAAVAAGLVSALDWPAGTQVDVVTVVPTDADAAGAQAVPTGPAAGLADKGLSVACEVLVGRPAAQIVDYAAGCAADLIVVGSRGHGTIASMVLGSVAAEILRHAGRPVLVARKPVLTRAVLGHDGSACSDEAVRVVSEWPIFGPVPIDVIAVAELKDPWHLASSSTLYGTTVHDYFKADREILEAHSKLADRIAGELVAAGRQATPLMAEGHPAAKLIEMAQLRFADLIVVGTRGRAGISQLVLGSVARNVATHSPTSVLVACRAASYEPG